MIERPRSTAARGAAAGSRVLVAHPDPERLATLTFHVAAAGLAVTTARTGADVVAALQRHPPTVLLLSDALSDRSGFTLARRARALAAHREFAVLLMLTAGAADDGRHVEAFEFGADDCVPDDIGYAELVRRVRSVARRFAVRGPASDEVLCVGPVILDRGTGDIAVAGQRVPLTPTEFALLGILLRDPGRLFTRAQLDGAVWPAGRRRGRRAVEAHIYRLRRKLGRWGALLECVPDTGYRFRDPPGADAG